MSHSEQIAEVSLGTKTQEERMRFHITTYRLDSSISDRFNLSVTVLVTNTVNTLEKM